MPSSTTDSKGKERQPPVVQPGSGNSIIINPCQRLNPIVECIRNVPKEFADILPDYQVGRTTGVLFLSLRYHRLHPEYIHQRIERLGQSYNLRILLLMCDISEHQDPIRELTRVCLLNNITVIVAWSADEAAQYLTAYKQSEHRAPTLIRERVDKTPGALLRTALTSIPRVNKTDVETLRTAIFPTLMFSIRIGDTQSFARIAQADAAQLARLPGFGPKKVVRLKDAFERPFRTGTTSALANPSATASASVSALPPTDPSSSTTTTTSSAPTTAQHPSSSSSRTKAGNASESTGERAPAPDSMWDIDLDLNSPSPPPSLPETARNLLLPPQETTGPGPGPSSKRVREESPPWDIEVEGDTAAPALRERDQDPGEEDDADAGAGADAEMDDDDIAPALRAKRRRA
ncbi:restriction endonuclease type II-like protein [Russula dissimulans]|nr:restriction endonuclease type II-like protein [Russula dissimulans]